jgi:uncharacterized repeat protein (TIGR03803 family)
MSTLNHLRSHLLLAGGTLLLAFPALTAAQTYSSLFLFSGNDGKSPIAPVTVGQGVLYGTTAFGGAGGFGNVFSLTPPAAAGGGWTETLLHTFKGSDGFSPIAGVVIGANGVLYGTTYLLGPAKWGTVYSLTPPASPGGSWTEATLHAFSGTESASTDGGGPQAPVTISSDGMVYGTTTYGGAFGTGTAFALTPPASPGGAWTETVLHSFGGTGDGSEPISGLVIGSDKVLYGTTYTGGAYGGGTVFALNPPTASGESWKESVIYSFSGGNDGSSPYYGSLVIGSGGVLYGTTYTGGVNDTGTVFSLTPPSTAGGAWKEAVLYNFTYDGAKLPLGGLAINSAGHLFGTASTGGSAQDEAGAVFRLTPPAAPGADWQFSILHNFTYNATQGEVPYAGVVLGPTGALFGTTSGLVFDGPGNNGSVFALAP